MYIELAALWSMRWIHTLYPIGLQTSKYIYSPNMHVYTYMGLDAFALLLDVMGSRASIDVT